VCTYRDIRLWVIEILYSVWRRPSTGFGIRGSIIYQSHVFFSQEVRHLRERVLDATPSIGVISGMSRVKGSLRCPGIRRSISSMNNYHTLPITISKNDWSASAQNMTTNLLQNLLVMPSLNKHNLCTILLIVQVIGYTNFILVALLVGIIERELRSLVSNSNSWISAVTPNVRILALSTGLGLVSRIIYIWSCSAAAKCPSGVTRHLVLALPEEENSR
jgi:hypothetical protein